MRGGRQASPPWAIAGIVDPLVRLPIGFTKAILAAALLGAAALAACGTPAKPVAPRAAGTSSAAAPPIDVCLNDKPPPRAYFGPLRAARCEQEMFQTMAGIARDLDVKCSYCHVPKGDSTFEYPEMTPKKEIAAWMSHTFMTGLKRADGRPMTCGSCHVDKAGKPSAKFLGAPRDTAWAVEWMTTVMTTRFTLADGSKLKCKHCHVGTWGTPTFEPKVIGRTAQVPHGELPALAPVPDLMPSDGAGSAAPSIKP